MKAEESESMGCPECGRVGRSVKPITLHKLLTGDARKHLDAASNSSFRFCKNETCEAVYYSVVVAQQFRAEDVRVPVFQKSTAPERPVCYCFDHTVTSVTAEVSRMGSSEVLDSIADACKRGLDTCEETNPQGSCCLGNVRQLVKTATVKVRDEIRTSLDEPHDMPDSGVPEAGEDAHDCCAPTASGDKPSGDENTDRGPRAGLLSAGGAFVAAVLASACCWLPLALVALGTSAIGVAGFFEAYRVHFLAATAILLGGGFYFIYFRKPKCAPGDACEVPDPKLQRFSKIMLWVATILVLGFATFPNYIGYILGTGDDVSDFDDW